MALGVVVIALAAALALWLRGRSSPDAAAEPSAPPPSAHARELAQIPLPEPKKQVDFVPGIPKYGRNPEGEFIRQRHDYPPDTPERLGPKIGRVLFDLETVIDDVSQGDDPLSRIATQRDGKPLDASQKEAARDILQEFFDDAAPIVDGALVGDITLDEAFEQLLEMRKQLNCDLKNTMLLSGPQLYELWPQMEGFVAENCDHRPPPIRSEPEDEQHQRVRRE